MASVYPGALDSFSEPSATLAGPPTHEDLHLQLSDALAAVQGELGVNPSASLDSVAARLAHIYTCFPRVYGPGSTTSGTIDSVSNITYQTAQLIIPPHSNASLVAVWGRVNLVPSESGWEYAHRLAIDGGLAFAESHVTLPAADMRHASSCTGLYVLPANTGITINQTITPLEAAGTVNFPADSTQNHLMAVVFSTIL